ncbi:MAG: hypothetical protein QOG01_4007, partial [Pseudonocardiales bacterium]|nr:hypothetical protein [Pseudonocardiales bacterium]
SMPTPFKMTQSYVQVIAYNTS